MLNYRRMADKATEFSGGISHDSAVNGLSVVSYAGQNYMRAICSGGWCVAFLNHGDRFAAPTSMERHLKSDEVFVLLAGEATLRIGEDRRAVKMTPGMIYNVQKGVWHQIFTQPGASCLIVENADTSAENSERVSI